MKHLFIVLTLLTTTTAFAMDCSKKDTEEFADEMVEIKTDVPKHLKGATITITLADGRTSVVSADKFKVVPRKQQYLVTKTVKVSEKMCVVTEEGKRHRVSLMAGHGAQEGLTTDRKESPNKVTIESNVGVVAGAQYQYRTDLKLITLPVSIGIQGQTNKTGSVMLGLDF